MYRYLLPRLSFGANPAVYIFYTNRVCKSYVHYLEFIGIRNAKSSTSTMPVNQRTAYSGPELFVCSAISTRPSVFLSFGSNPGATPDYQRGTLSHLSNSTHNPCPLDPETLQQKPRQRRENVRDQARTFVRHEGCPGGTLNAAAKTEGEGDFRGLYLSEG